MKKSTFGFGNRPKAEFYHSLLFCFGRLWKMQLRSLPVWRVQNLKKERQNTFFVWVFCLDGGLVNPRKSITAPVTAVFSFFFVGFLGPALKNEGTSRSSWFMSNILANPDILWYCLINARQFHIFLKFQMHNNVHFRVL